MDRWEQFNLIIDNENLDAKEKSMLLILFRFVQNGTDTAYPSRERIKKLYGSKKNDVIDKVLKSLEDKKLLIREKDSGKKTKYHLYIGTEIEPGITTEPGTQIEPSTIIEPGSQIEPIPGSQIEPTPGSQIEPQKEKKKKKEKKNNNSATYEEIISYLNLKADKNFKANTPNTQQHINARLEEGYTIDDFKTVINNKVSDWKDKVNYDKNGNKFEGNKFLRPKTLFSGNFESYLNEKPTVSPKDIKENNSFVNIYKSAQSNILT